jgi:hypothetical protein
MKTFKKLKEKKINLNGTVYKPYDLGNIPLSFGVIRSKEGEEGISEWFNYQGLTYLRA